MCPPCDFCRRCCEILATGLLHRRILTSHVFLHCVKRSLHNSRLIKLFTRACWSQCHANNGFFKLVKALQQICSCFYSSRITIYVPYTAISSITVSLHNLPRCLRSTATCRVPVQWFEINPHCTQKNTFLQSHKACVTNKNIWVCIFDLKR